MKKILFLLTIAAVMCQACRKDKNDTTPPSDDGLDLTLDIDWSALDQTPSGLTLMLYPTDGGDASDAAPIAHRTSNVSNPKISLPGQDYALICFNQSEAELSDYTFDLSSYATASVTADDPSHLAPLAVASMNSLHPTRALNLMGVLKPTNVVKSMSLKIHVAGMSERAEVRGTLTNMAQGVTLFDRKPLPATIDQPLPPDVWNIALPPDAAQPAELIATFPTFGVFVDDKIRVATRSAADFDLHNILHVTVKDIDDGSIIYEDEIDVTEEVVEQYLASLEEPTAYEAVDLGLSVQWATCNIGASRPEDFGDYLAWGETSAKTTYDWSTYKWAESQYLTKYTASDNRRTLWPDDDAAAVRCGEDWSVPTWNEWQELRDNCTWNWTDDGTRKGYLVTGTNGRSIFLPAASGIGVDYLDDSENAGFYWCNLLHRENPQNATTFAFNSANIYPYCLTTRCFGQTIRPVRRTSPKVDVAAMVSSATGQINGISYVDMGDAGCWAMCNIGAQSPFDYGDYFAWGETATKDDYSWEAYRWCNGTSTSLTKYNQNTDFGSVDGLYSLNPDDDAATSRYGDKWHVPSTSQAMTLVNNCTWTWVEQGDTVGYIVTSGNGNSLFLPTAGTYGANYIGPTAAAGYYWLSTTYHDSPSEAYTLGLNRTIHNIGNITSRFCGLPIRPMADVTATDIESGSLKFRIFGSSATVTGHIGDIYGSVEIPESVTYGGEEIRVTAIGESAFNDCVDITSVTMPNSIKAIGENAFQFCHSLASVTLSDSLTSIGYKAFNECPFTTIKLPASLRTLESNAFDNCTNLESIVIPEGVTEIKEQTFMFCHRLASVKLPESLTSIGHAAFMDCDSLKSITIPSGVTSIEQQLFYGCRSLQSVNLPDGITKIGHYAFEGCQMLASIQLPNSVTSAGQGTFTGCSSLSAFSFPTSLTSIGDYMFRDCKALASIHIPASVTEIGNAIFYGCSNLAEVTVDGANPNYATSDGMLLGKNDGKMLFYFGRASSLVIPDYVASIMPYAFSGNETLTSLTIPNSVKEIQDWAFGECDNIETLTYDTEAIGSTFNGKHSLKAVNIGNSVRSIGDEAFYECIGLEEITIPASVTSIGREAFQGCHALASVTLSDSLTSIGYKAFNECPFTTIKLPASLRTLESNVFDNCQSLTAIELPEGLTEVSEGLFYICRALTTVTIPSTVTKIGGTAFEDCKSLSDVYCYATEPPAFEESSFNGIGAQATLHVPAASVEKYRAAWGGIFANVAAIGN